MANSGSITTGGYGSQGRALQFNWNLAGQNVAGNYSVINWEIRGVGGDTSTWYKCGPVYGNINGGQCCARGDRFNLYNGTVVASGQWTIGHNNDGSKSFGADISGAIYSASVNVSASGSWELPRIPRASVINSFSGNNIEGDFKVTYTSYYSGFTNKLRISIPSVKALQTFNYSSGSTFKLSQDTLNYLYNYMKTTNSVTLGAVIETWNGGTKIGESSELKNVCTITNADPIFSDFSYKDNNSETVKVTGNNQVLVKGLSQLLVTISTDNKMETLKGATPKNYVMTLDTINKSADYSDNELNIDLGAVNVIGNQRLNVRAYDSRNNSVVAYKDIDIYDYDKPVIHASVTRLNNFENQTTLKVNGTYSKLEINNQNKNTIKNLQYRYRETNGTWSSWKNLTSTINDGNFTCNDVILSLDNTKSFEFEVQAIDNLQTTTLPLELDVGQAIFFISSNKKACYINGQEILTYDVVDTW